MNAVTLVKHNLTHYWRTTLAVILGVATAVLAGAFLVGDSVRASLRDLALARLGKTDQVVTASGFFRERLADDLQSHDQFAANFNDACPIIALEAVVTRDENNARAGDVQVYGVDDRFWKFHGANTQTPEGNDVLVSQALPVHDPRHQFDSEQMGQTKNRFALPVTVGMNDLRLNLAPVFHQDVESEQQIKGHFFHRFMVTDAFARQRYSRVDQWMDFSVR